MNLEGDRSGRVGALTTGAIRVLVVDDVAEVRDSLARLLGRLDGVQVVGAAADGMEAVGMVEQHEPNVVLMDLRMPGMDGIEATREIVRHHPQVGVLVLSAYGDDSLVIEALLAGARGYLLKGTPVARLADAVVGAAAGQAHLAGQVTRPLLERLVEMLRRERDARRAIEAARLESERLARSQQQFATMAAHELRSPLAALLGSLVSLERLHAAERLDPTAQELLAACTRQARRLARLAEDLTVVAQAPAGIAVQPAQIELRPVIDEVVADLGHLGVERVRVTAPAGLRAWADPDRLGQVLTNLLRNALQYSAPSAPVEVDAGTDLGSAWITVADHGPGISPERLPSLFERFSDHELDAEAGLGVGLWIVRELLRAMRGAVTVDRNAAGGTTFRVVLPAGPGVRLAERR